jgi:hypothetical protein
MIQNTQKTTIDMNHHRCRGCTEEESMNRLACAINAQKRITIRGAAA